MSIKGEREYLIKMKENELGFVPAEIPLDFNGDIFQWELELKSRLLWDGETPAKSSELRLTISQWSAIVDSIENFNLNNKNYEPKSNYTNNRSIRI